MRSILFWLIPLCLLFSVACDNDDDAADLPAICDQVIEFTPLTMPPLVVVQTINDLSIQDNCLTIDYSNSGCDGSTWEVALYAGEEADTNPVQRNVELVIWNAEVCQAFISKQTSFDLTPLQMPGQTAVMLNFGADGPTVTYNYGD